MPTVKAVVKMDSRFRGNDGWGQYPILNGQGAATI